MVDQYVVDRSNGFYAFVDLGCGGCSFAGKNLVGPGSSPGPGDNENEHGKGYDCERNQV